MQVEAFLLVNQNQNAQSKPHNVRAHAAPGADVVIVEDVSATVERKESGRKRFGKEWRQLLPNRDKIQFAVLSRIFKIFKNDFRYR